MRNKYKIIGDYVEIYLRKRNTKNPIITVIDTEVLPRVLKVDITWTASWRKNTKTYYVEASKYLGIIDGKPKYKTISLHGLITRCRKSKKVDHIDHDTLNNKRSNLRVVSNTNNVTNRKSKNSNNKSGYRNVCMMGGKWRVQLQVNRKRHLFPEKFDNVESAGKFAQKMRKKYYGEFAGNE